ncbi:HAD family hydrolase [Paractinoplanes rhizophilus]|uniref:phosphoserine phosphatase n=1 Tax=Paractinoplanes rhizophilus TaxID=1416877 RepID=A0ABW2I5L7_9ACTN
MPSSTPVGAIFFDVDGTLVPNTSSSAYLAGFMGHQEEVNRVERDYANGILTNQQVSAVDAAGWAGQTHSNVMRWLTGLPLVDGISDVVEWSKQRRLEPILATLAWEPVGKYLASRFGFHSYCGSQLEIVDGAYTGNVIGSFDEYDKLNFAIRQAELLGFPIGHCAAIGDSRSDLPLFEAVGLSVAFNASEGVRRKASATATGPDIRAVIPSLASHFART